MQVLMHQNGLKRPGTLWVPSEGHALPELKLLGFTPYLYKGRYWDTLMFAILERGWRANYRQ